MAQDTDWSKVPNFTQDEFDYPNEIVADVLYMLQTMRTNENRRSVQRGGHGIIITINSDYRLGDPGQHGKGRALDVVIRDARTREPLPITMQFWMAQFYLWTGIGMYPYWKEPGLHLDLKPVSPIYSRRRTWCRQEDGKYIAVEEYMATVCRNTFIT